MQTAEPSVTVSRLQSGVRRAEPMVWLSAGAVVLALMVLLGLLTLLASRGFPHFWPQPLIQLQSAEGNPQIQLGVILDRELDTKETLHRVLLHRGAEDYYDSPLLWIDEGRVTDRKVPESAVVIERKNQGPVFGFLQALETKKHSQALTGLSPLAQIARVETALSEGLPGAGGLLQLRLASGRVIEVSLEDLRTVYAPNAMTARDKIAHFFAAMGRFLGDSPRQGNSQGGVFPAILGTVILVILMALIVSPVGVLAAIYLQEYAYRGPVTRLVRIAVNNLAGVPSVVYGVFGLGFFVYAIGGSLDALLFEDRLPTPTLGSPGLLWSALTMALLTLPVVIVSTEEGLARVPTSLREGSLALGATRAETLWNVVLPAASPAILTGLILAIARATGEVAPLLLVGVAKYAPGLPVSGEFPYLHLDRQFMHLGFSVYDLGFQSTHIETVEGLVFATALLLVLIALLLNIAAVLLRSRLRNAFKPQEAV
ncbi:phosphate ABC transporter membrane protein 2, PhoT family [Congregibacter litoralis KT71]|uniref:Phosphate transport system permease protein PstA n=2 Tax=Congregibacter TaxID=393661 RepID=A4A3L6_9GAMM|nr:phosphate ABC transporter membrane protein 2, PhoT family [Congregibacter litoralis KT71]